HRSGRASSMRRDGCRLAGATHGHFHSHAAPASGPGPTLLVLGDGHRRALVLVGPGGGHGRRTAPASAAGCGLAAALGSGAVACRRGGVPPFAARARTERGGCLAGYRPGPGVGRLAGPTAPR